MQRPSIDPEALAALLRALPLVKNEEDRARLQALHRLLDRKAVIFLSPEIGVFEVPDPDNPGTCLALAPKLLAAAGAHLALTYAGERGLVRSIDFARTPEPKDCEDYPPLNVVDNSVRNGLSRFIDYLEQKGQRVIAHAVRQIEVTDGYLYAPTKASAYLILS